MTTNYRIPLEWAVTDNSKLSARFNVPNGPSGRYLVPVISVSGGPEDFNSRVHLDVHQCHTGRDSSGKAIEQCTVLARYYDDIESAKAAAELYAFSTTIPLYVCNRNEFECLSASLGVRRNWHEPDEQEVTIEFVEGRTFDNAFVDLAGSDGVPLESGILIRQYGQIVAFVNAAILFGIANGGIE
jgi:hypothetical protein